MIVTSYLVLPRITTGTNMMVMWYYLGSLLVQHDGNVVLPRSTTGSNVITTPYLGSEGGITTGKNMVIALYLPREHVTLKRRRNHCMHQIDGSFLPSST